MYRDYIKNGFIQKKLGPTVVFAVPAIEELGFYRHGFFSRIGGVSPAPYDSLNFSVKREGSVKNVRENFGIAARALGVDPDAMMVVNYEHGAGVALAKEEYRGMGIFRENKIPPCDGMVSAVPGLTAVALHADCTPLFFADKNGRCAGVAHAGWRGTYQNMAGNMVREMGKAGSLEKEIYVGVGPCIGPCCFEVQSDLVSLFVGEYGSGVLREEEGKTYIDLVGVTLIQLERAGIPPEQVTVSGLCTCCQPEWFFSHRRERGATGSMASMIQMKNR